MAKNKKAHTIGKTLIKSCLAKCAGILQGESVVMKLKQVPMTNDSVKFRTADMARDVKSQLIENIKASPVFGIQLDESVDIANLLTTDGGCSLYPRLMNTFFCRPLETTTKATDVLVCRALF